MSKVEFRTSGRGYWTTFTKTVSIVDIKLRTGTEWDEGDITGELRVHFDATSWDTYKDGLIYTDPKFLQELRKFLVLHGLPGKDVDYSEQGMQGRTHVSLDAGTEFYEAWIAKFGLLRNQLVKQVAW